MKIFVDYVTNLLYKIPILAQEGTSPETTCRRSQEWRPATAARNRTAGGPDPDRQAVMAWRGQSLQLRCPTAGDASVGPRPKIATVEQISHLNGAL
jgi:hypothetical protein